jgi:F-type H+-transporting ATPase subunit delta
VRNVSVARRYARALFELANEAGKTEAVQGALFALAHAFETSPELRGLFENPSHSRAQRWAVLEELLGAVKAKDPSLLNAIQLLNDRDRLAHLPLIARLFGEMADERAGRVRGKVTAAVPLSKEALHRLETVLAQITQREVVLETHTDPSVLGGVAAQVGSHLYDGTLRSQLEHLRRTLKG